MENHLTVSDNCLDLTTESEGCKLIPYNDGRGFATVGIGHLLHRSPINSNDKPITWEQARVYLKDDLGYAQDEVNVTVTTQLNQNQFDAIVDFVFNVGDGLFEKSSVLLFLNAGDFETASAHLNLYVFAGGKIEPGLVVRRKKEVALFNKPC